MAAITISIQKKIPQLRPLNILRDLPNVADLIEKCFAETMDAEGRSYLQQMRRAGQDNTFLHWASTAVETASMPLSGYVWEENGQIIGNVSLIPHRHKHKRIFLIANVAVHPDFRRRGIGQALTYAAIVHAQQRHGSETWLHVRDDNPGAIRLYEALGFEEQARRTTWQAKPDHSIVAPQSREFSTRRSNRDWTMQESWLHQLYPELLTWYQPMPWTSLRPNFGSALYRFMMDVSVRHWTAHSGGNLNAAVSWMALTGQADHLWVAVPPKGSEITLENLLLFVRRQLTWRQNLVLDFPFGQYAESIKEAGFSLHRTLLWMKLNPEKLVNHP